MTTTPAHQPFSIQSADELPREHAPPEYRPHRENGPCVYDDELETLERIPAWRMYFAGGSNRMHFILVGADQQLHFVEQTGFGGPYDYCGPACGPDREAQQDGRFENAYDAFWSAETAAGTPTDPACPSGRKTEREER